MIVLPEYTQNLRLELRQLRIRFGQLSSWKNKQKEHHEELLRKLKEVEKERNSLKRENEQLKAEIEKITKTKNRYQVSLFDHGNFTHPEEKNKKKKGGQQSHTDTNREAQEDRSSYQRKHIFAEQCGYCGSALSRTKAVKEKLLLDIVLSPQAVKFILETERQWCGTCQKEVLAKDTHSLPFTEYGINIFMTVLFLRFRCLLSFEKIGAVTSLLGVAIAPSVINTILVQAKTYLGSRYEELLTAVRKGELMYNDETGWMVRGKSAWMWVAANEEATVYKAAESRGKGIFQELYGTSTADSMHDGYSLYESVTGKKKSLYCWSHFLRFSFEETTEDPPDSDGIHLREQLVEIYQRKKRDPTITEEDVDAAIQRLLHVVSTQQSVKAIQYRLRVQKEGLIRALFVSPDGTNNRSEQELRPLATMRYTSSGSDTYRGMEVTALLSSIVRTQLKKPIAHFFPDMKTQLSTGVKQSSWQYCHTAFVEG